MSRHHPDLVMCRKAAGISIGRLCDKCDGKCPVCDSYVRPTTLARVCDECSFGNYQNKCIVCGGEGISDAFYCFECTRLEKDRDGCPKIINLGSSRTDLFLNIFNIYSVFSVFNLSTMTSLSLALLLVAFFASSSLAWLPGNSSTSITKRSLIQRSSNDSVSASSSNSTSSWTMRGVNLGSLFIIEKWMAYNEFRKMGCASKADEWSCVEYLGQETADSAFATHWDTWITQDDIQQIVSYGLNTVRVPIGFWIKEDLVQEDEYYPRGGLQYLDRLMGWCSDAGLYVILDLHAGAGVQAVEQQFTGHVVEDPGFYNSSNYERTLQCLEWLTERVHTTTAYRNVGMIEVMNEPVHTSAYASQAADMVQNFYPPALNRIRAVESSICVASSDQVHVQYMAKAWGSGDPTTYLTDTYFTSFDDHRYIKWDTSVTRTRDGYLQAACNYDNPDVVVGEWSLGIADSVSSSSQFAITNATSELIDWYQQYWAAQASGYEKGIGWVFWSWKCNKINYIDEWRWCYQSAVNAGVIPTDASQAAAIAEDACQAVSTSSTRELGEVINDIKALTSDEQPDLINKLKPAIEKYNEDQLVGVKLPGTSQHVIISAHNRLADGRYYDTRTRKAFRFDHLTGTASQVQPYDGGDDDSSSSSSLITSLNAALAVHFAEHYPAASTSSSSGFLTLRGTVRVNVHYYEDGNVALTTTKAIADTGYQEQVNRTFVSMNEQGFKALRRQLPVTRQKVDWEKIRAYNLSDTLKGARED
ncbi:hypothetical protein DV738_g1316, partial [Chaetothyriales sp. CBS 135597]